MREEDKVYVENNTFTIVELYVEGYMYSKQDPENINNNKRKYDTLDKVKKEIKDVIYEESEHLCITPEEILEILIECLQSSKEHKMKYFEEEYTLLDDIFQNLSFDREPEQEQER